MNKPRNITAQLTDEVFEAVESLYRGGMDAEDLVDEILHDMKPKVALVLLETIGLNNGIDIYEEKD
jgi:hypothetical protein